MAIGSLSLEKIQSRASWPLKKERVRIVVPCVYSVLHERTKNARTRVRMSRKCSFSLFSKSASLRHNPSTFNTTLTLDRLFLSLCWAENHSRRMSFSHIFSDKLKQVKFQLTLDNNFKPSTDNHGHLQPGCK